MQSLVVLLLRCPIFALLQYFINADCSFEFNSSFGKVGNFSSPNFPGKYHEDLECIYHFVGKEFETLNLSFHVFDLEAPFSKGCLTDYADISSISIQNEKQLVGRYCGSQSPFSLLFMHPIAEIIFKSNHVVHHRGFHGKYEFTDEKFIPPPLSTPSIKNCGGIITGVGGVITSPGYPNKFPKNIDCVWLIRVNYNQNIYLRILQLQLYGSIANCGEAELAIIDGYSNIHFTPKILQKYCGDLKYYKNVDDQTQLSDRNRVIVRFQTSVSVEEKGEEEDKKIVGFKLVWTAVTFEDQGDCQQFVCKESLFCVNSASKSCTKTRHYCIDKSLVCNSLPNCGMDDFSDEDKCNLPLVAGCSGAAAMLLLIVIISIFVYRRHAIRKSLSQSQGLTMQLRQLEHSPSFATRQIGHFYSQPSDIRGPHEVNCSVHSHYDVIINNRYGGYPTEV